MPQSFVPRPEFRVKPWAAKVQENDTTSAITRRFLGDASSTRYRELVAANLPHAIARLDGGGSVTLDLTEGEQLLIPETWPDPGANAFAEMVNRGMVVGTVGSPVLDTSNPVFVAAVASGTKAGISDAAEAGAVLNAVVQWYMGSGLSPTNPVNTDVVDAMTARAREWYASTGKTLPSAQAAVFPWSVLPLFFGASGWDVDFTTLDWTKDIPGAPTGLSWDLVPWDLLAKAGPPLESTAGPIPAIAVPAQGPYDAATIRAAFQASLDASSSGFNLPANASCPLTSPYSTADGMCHAPDGTTSPPACANGLLWDPVGMECTAGGPLDCPEGSAHPGGDPTKPCAPICPDPRMTWDPVDKSCACPPGEAINPATNMCAVPPPPPAPPPRSIVKPVVIGGLMLAGAFGIFKLAQKQAADKKKKKAEEK